MRSSHEEDAAAMLGTGTGLRRFSAGPGLAVGRMGLDRRERPTNLTRLPLQGVFPLAAAAGNIPANRALWAHVMS